MSSPLADISPQFDSVLQDDGPADVGKPSSSPSKSPRLLPSAQITPGKNPPAQGPVDERLRDGLAIERPRSALHTGDFTHDRYRPCEPTSRMTTSKAEHRMAIQTPPWITTSPPRDFAPFRHDRRRTLPQDDGLSFRSAVSPLSSSVSSSFAYQPPTSPLVQSESNDELDFSILPSSLYASLTPQPSRCHGAVSPHHLSPAASPLTRPSMAVPSWSHLQRRDSSMPYQAHQPRRSLSSVASHMLHDASPQALAMPRLRRPSLGSDVSPIRHASMVGSYEESILRGRMSTTPSKPFDFLAQIGVLGKGKCKSSLRCPAHVTLPFPAVYYSYGSTPHGRSRSDDGPSPYVGQIDIENGLPNPDEESRSKRKAQSRYPNRRPAEGNPDGMPGAEPDAERRGAARSKRRSGSPKAPPGGSYRIPEKGQVQIVIKNENKTAVKLFLLPYDLTGMEPGTKTFIRQRSYSAGPIIDHVPNLSEGDRMSRPMLRYLVHMHICCPSKGRFYLYKSIRVVFANRVPEGKERLRNETTCPEPRFTPYKPIRVMHPPVSASVGPGAMLAADKALRRRSLGVSFGASSRRVFDMVDGLEAGGGGGGNTLPVDPVPFRLPLPPLRDRGDSDVSASTTSVTGAAGVRSPSSSQASRPSTMDRDVAAAGLGPWGAAQYEKLRRGDLGYGGLPSSGSVAGGGAAEGLLSRRLRSLGVQPRGAADD